MPSWATNRLGDPSSSMAVRRRDGDTATWATSIGIMIIEPLVLIYAAPKILAAVVADPVGLLG